MFKRTEESALTSWFFEVDRKVLYMVLLMIGIGVYFAISAGSVAAERINQPWYFFALKGMPFYLLGLVVLFVTSMLSKKIVLKIALLDVVVGLTLLAVTFVAPHTIKGSARWVSISGFNILPADIMKPGFIFITAWFLAKMREKFGDNLFVDKEAWKIRLFSWWSYMAVFLSMMIIIFTHPDVGTSLLYLGVLGIMLIIAGLPMLVVGGLGALGGGALLLAYYIMPHVHNRFQAMLNGTGDNYQVTQSVQAIQHGGFFGKWSDAFIKQSLPDSHTDFIYAVIVEDMGAILACVLLGLLVYLLKLLISDALNARDKFVFYAVGGTAALFGIQTCINMVSTLHILPPKGMTLPFISYGGSSLVGFCLLFGMVLAVVREDKWK